MVANLCCACVSTELPKESVPSYTLILGSFLGPRFFLACLCSVLEKFAVCCCARCARHPRAVHGRDSDRIAGESARSSAIEGALIVAISDVICCCFRDGDGIGEVPPHVFSDVLILD